MLTYRADASVSNMVLCYLQAQQPPQQQQQYNNNNNNYQQYNQPPQPQQQQGGYGAAPMHQQQQRPQPTNYGAGESPAKQITPIERLNPYQNRWTIKARVMSKGAMKYALFPWLGACFVERFALAVCALALVSWHSSHSLASRSSGRTTTPKARGVSCPLIL